MLGEIGTVALLHPPFTVVHVLAAPVPTAPDTTVPWGV